MEPLAQTNLQLYRQMLARGYDDEGLLAVHNAYLFASRQTAGMLRGSGKPFICHLVGSASALCESRQPAYCLSAGLLHAMYQNRVPFGRNLPVEARRQILRERFGDRCEALVYGYHTFEWARHEEHLRPGSELGRTVVLMHLADALEDMLDEAMVMHGKPGETEAVWGTGAWRVKKWSALEPELVAAARRIGEEVLAKQISVWMEANRKPSFPASLKTGEYSSFNVLPE